MVRFTKLFVPLGLLEAIACVFGYFEYDTAWYLLAAAELILAIAICIFTFAVDDWRVIATLFLEALTGGLFLTGIAILNTSPASKNYLIAVAELAGSGLPLMLVYALLIRRAPERTDA